MNSDARHLKEEIAHLNMEKTRLENIVGSFQINNETCLKNKQIVMEEIEMVISNPRKLLRSALKSIFESSKRHPGKHLTLYYNRSSTWSSINRNEQDLDHYEYSEDGKLLLDEAEQSCINEIISDTEPTSRILQLPDKLDGLSTAQDCHTCPDTFQCLLPRQPNGSVQFA